MNVADVIRITGKRVFIRYSECPILKECMDVEVDIPVLPLPGNMFDGKYFLTEEQNRKIKAQNVYFFVKDVQHEFYNGEQYCYIVLHLVSAKGILLTQRN